MWTLMDHLKLMGENSSLAERRPMISRETFVAAASIYQELFSRSKEEILKELNDEKEKEKLEKSNLNSMIQATFDVIYWIAWKPDPSQPKPKKRGSAQISLAELATEVGSKLHMIEETDHGTIKEGEVNFDDLIKKNKPKSL